MKKQKPKKEKPAIAWDDGDDATPAATEKPKGMRASGKVHKKLETLSSKEDLERYMAKPPIPLDIIGVHPKGKGVTTRDESGEKKIPLATGAYLSEHRCSALVYEVSRGKVHCVMLGGTNGIEEEIMSIERFVHDFPVAMPNYPFKRAARIYLNSGLPKSESAVRILRGIVKG